MSKNAKYLNVNIKAQIYDELSLFHEHTGISKTAAVEHALRMYMDDMYAKGTGVKPDAADLPGGGK